MTATLPRIRVFRYIPDLDGFDVTDRYREIADAIGITEWNPVVWIGRLATMDNDYGEHWFDNWELREAKASDAKRLGLDSNDLLFIDPERFQNGKDGPCHAPEFRKRFWTDVLISLELDPQLLFDEARAFNRLGKTWLEAHPDDPVSGKDYIPDLEERIAEVINRLENEGPGPL